MASARARSAAPDTLDRTSDVEAWSILANRAMQLEILAVDLAENAAWAATMRALVERSLPYEEFTELRLQALSDRVRGRKLNQTNLPVQVRVQAR
jgi:hypothetical protein